jgi:hypothetical protein
MRRFERGPVVAAGQLVQGEGKRSQHVLSGRSDSNIAAGASVEMPLGWCAQQYRRAAAGWPLVLLPGGGSDVVLPTRDHKSSLERNFFHLCKRRGAGQGGGDPVAGCNENSAFIGRAGGEAGLGWEMR